MALRRLGIVTIASLSLACAARPTGSATEPRSPAFAPLVAKPFELERLAPRALGGGPPAEREAVDSLAAAQCARLDRCGRIGAERSYPSRTTCVTEQRARIEQTLNGTACAVRQAGLARCMAVLEKDHCPSELALLVGAELPAACSTDAMCSPNDQGPESVHTNFGARDETWPNVTHCSHS